MQRIAIGVYAVTAYLVFLATFAYAAGFVDDLPVPKPIDGPSTGSPLLAAIVDAGLLGLFAVQHSVMARPAFKRWWTRIVPAAAERSTYVLAASLALAVTFWQWRPLPAAVWAATEEPLRTLLLGVSLLGWALVVGATFMIDHLDLFGLRQGLLFAFGRAYKPPPFMTRGAYAFVRHPIMTGMLVAFWAAPRMSAGHLLFAGLATGYIIVGVWFEERDLRRSLGATYTQYALQVPGLLPLPWLRARQPR
jgi:methanethiol S-methyltransferase